MFVGRSSEPERGTGVRMRVLKKSREKPVAGDIFTYQMPDGLFRFGRVIRTGCPIASWPDVILAYFYRAASDSPAMVPLLSKRELLIAPIGIGAGGWRRGYFQTVRREPLRGEDCLEVHCFEEAWCSPPRYWTENGERLAERREPCQVWGVFNPATLESMLTEALEGLAGE